MSITEILEELPKLKQGDRWAVWRRLSELENSEAISASPELLAAIDEGVRSADTQPRLTVEEVRQKLKQCIQKLR